MSKDSDRRRRRNRCVKRAVDAVTHLIADEPPGDLANYLSREGDAVEVDFFGTPAFLLPVIDPEGNTLIVAVVADDDDTPRPWREAAEQSLQDAQVAAELAEARVKPEMGTRSLDAKPEMRTKSLEILRGQGEIADKKEKP